MRTAFKAAFAIFALASSFSAFAGEAPSPARADAMYARMCANPKAVCGSGRRAEIDHPGVCGPNAFDAVLTSNNFQVVFYRFRKAFEMGEAEKMKAAAESGQRFAGDCGEAAKAFFERKAKEWEKG